MDWYAVFANFVILAHVVGGVRELHEKCHPDEQQALVEFRDGLVIGGLESWREGEGEDCCKWSGVTCNNITGYVVRLHLTHLSFFPESKISPALLKIQHLQHLHIGLNDPLEADVPSTMRTPGFLGSFNEMRYLNLSGSVFGEIPQTLGNLSKLEVLDLTSYYDFFANATSLDWLSGLRALSILNLNGVDLNSVGHEWIQVISSLPSLKELYLENCHLQAVTISTQAYFNFSSSLSVMDLSSNDEIGHNLLKWLSHSNMSSLVRLDASASGMNGSIAAMFFNLQNLEELYLFNNLINEFPASIGSMNASLRILDLSNNPITGGIPTEVGLLQNLRELDLGKHVHEKTSGSAIFEVFSSAEFDKRLEGALPHSLCRLKKLVTLSLGNNALNGTIPECLGLLSSLETLSLEHNRLEGNLPSTLGLLSSLETLSLKHNRLKGNLPATLGQLSRLRTLHLGINTLEGEVLETHFHHLTQLEELDFSSNFLKIQLPSNWVPPFRGLKVLYLDSCVVGPDYPPWIRMLKSLYSVGLSNTSIEGFLPHWFSQSSCFFDDLDLSNNKIQGKMQNIYDCSNKFGKTWDLSNNHLHGPIPLVNATFDFLSLSFNQFGGSIPSRLMSGEIVSYSIDVSDNQLIGEIPLSIGNCTQLITLDLSGNHLSGPIPVSMGNLQGLESLHLEDNNLSGMLPKEMINITNLMTLDLGGNKFTGRIPKWIGQSFGNLRFLRLRSNFFSMEIPKELMTLKNLFVLDVADNHLSGTIPHYIGNLTAMRTKQSEELKDLISVLSDSGRMTSFEERLDVQRNRRSYKYTKIGLSLVVSLDLANNDLSGEIPDELTDLIGLIMLNLSHNQFSAFIPERIGNLINLDTLDLSANRLSGKIPVSLTHIPRLASLNLSHNNLSGKIPMSPQLQTLVDPSIYDGNNGLCGFPLQKSCEEKKTNGSSSKPEDVRQKNLGFYVSIVAGFVAGFWCFSGPLLFKRSLRILYFQYMDRVIGMMSSN